MIGKTISHYKILDKLGSGGMGDVYKAEDTKLQRMVALKFLPAELTRDEEARQRFIQEARAASALDHPNICNIYEINKTEKGQMYIAMACYEGESLKEKIALGPFAINKALDIAIAIGQGLAKAHLKEIIHRDIKPANILITDEDQVKIIDFGLAMLADHTGLTKEGTTIGTIAYMSPEQTQGGPVDRRSDIWALGVVLYEMLTGENPFYGEYEQAVVYSITSEDPEFISKVRSDVPLRIEQIVQKALEKNPDKRFSSITEMQQTLQQALDLYKASQRAGIAIVPLENISHNKEQEWFTDGMSDALITNLARIGGLRVISRSSVMKYKNSNKTLKEIAGELGVNYVIEGSVIKLQDKIKISTRLIDTDNDEYLWANEYSRDLKDILSLQGELAQTIAKQIKVKLTPFEQNLLSEKDKISPEVYEAYLKGNFYLYKLTPQSIATSQKYYQMAMEVDPQYAPAYAGIALSYCVKVQMGYESINVVAKKAEQAVTKALELDSTLAEIHFVRAVIEAQQNWNWTTSVHSFEKALKLNPNMAEAHAYYSHVLFYMKKPDQAMEHIKRAIKLDPLNTLFKALYGMVLMYAHQYDKAICMLENSLQTDPGDIISLTTLRSAYHQKKMHDKALQTWEKYFEVRHDKEALDVLRKGGKEDSYKAALKRVAELFIERSKIGFITPWQIATLYTRAGMKEETLIWLEKAFEVHDPNMPYLIVDPIFDDMRNDPRFRDLLHRMNFLQGKKIDI